MWLLKNIEINGGFLAGLRIAFPPGLTCIIGPRGSGKSTLAELIRFAFSGASGLVKPRLELLQANLGPNGLITAQVEMFSGISYSVTRGLKQVPMINTAEGRALSGVDLDRGTFLPLDAYSSAEIESIADETLGEKRRALLDDLRSAELNSIQLSLNEERRLLDANADRIKSQRRLIFDLVERMEDLADARTKLQALAAPPRSESITEYAHSSTQIELNAQELERLSLAASWILALEKGLRASRNAVAEESGVDLVEPESRNAPLLQLAQADIRSTLNLACQSIDKALAQIAAAQERLSAAKSALEVMHGNEQAEFAKLTELNEASGALVRARTSLEQQVAQFDQLETRRVSATQLLDKLLQERALERARYLGERERISTLRQSVAEELQLEAGENVRLRVMRHADDLAYRQILLSSLRGARVRNHDDLLKSLLALRPEQLAQILDSNDVSEFEAMVSFGLDRSRKILEAMRENIDPLQLEVTPIEDQIRIELNVSSGAESNFKDASELSRGQKCTALLPLLLARRDTPLVIDQPEDNLDNHFIYETIVSSINRRKLTRQMIFITHNANIPVLAEADLVISMNSDGKAGYIETSGTVDECRDEIIDLLEGGEEAFALRSRRYARA